MIRMARIFGFLLPAALLAATLLAALQASAQENPDSKSPLNHKVLGRGIESRETHDVLQLACVDESVRGHCAIDPVRFSSKINVAVTSSGTLTIRRPGRGTWTQHIDLSQRKRKLYSEIRLAVGVISHFGD